MRNKVIAALVAGGLLVGGWFRHLDRFCTRYGFRPGRNRQQGRKEWFFHQGSRVPRWSAQ